MASRNFPTSRLRKCRTIYRRFKVNIPFLTRMASVSPDSWCAAHVSMPSRSTYPRRTDPISTTRPPDLCLRMPPPTFRSGGTSEETYSSTCTDAARPQELGEFFRVRFGGVWSKLWHVDAEKDLDEIESVGKCTRASESLSARIFAHTQRIKTPRTPACVSRRGASVHVRTVLIRRSTARPEQQNPPPPFFLTPPLPPFHTPKPPLPLQAPHSLTRSSFTCTRTPGSGSPCEFSSFDHGGPSCCVYVATNPCEGS